MLYVIIIILKKVHFTIQAESAVYERRKMEIKVFFGNLSDKNQCESPEQ